MIKSTESKVQTTQLLMAIITLCLLQTHKNSHSTSLANN